EPGYRIAMLPRREIEERNAARAVQQDVIGGDDLRRGADLEIGEDRPVRAKRRQRLFEARTGVRRVQLAGRVRHVALTPAAPFHSIGGAGPGLPTMPTAGSCAL